MSSFRQIEANRRNARLTTAPVTEEGKRKSRQNAVRQGLTAETVITALEDAEDYAANGQSVDTPADDLTLSFVRLTNLPRLLLDRLSRYEATLWRQACQITFTLRCLDQRKSWGKRRIP
jgi:hypothetical protein